MEVFDLNAAACGGAIEHTSQRLRLLCERSRRDLQFEDAILFARQLHALDTRSLEDLGLLCECLHANGENRRALHFLKDIRDSAHITTHLRYIVVKCLVCLRFQP